MDSIYTRIYPEAKEALDNIASNTNRSRVAAMSAIIHVVSELSGQEIDTILRIGTILQVHAQIPSADDSISNTRLIAHVRQAVKVADLCENS
jgi:hypothetical protein